MKFSKKIIIPALALAAFTAIGVGSTYAIFTSEANTNIAVTSGKVSVTATVENVKLYSGVYNDTTEAYDSVEQADKFLNGGTVTVENGVVTLDKVTPMDKVEFDVKVVNNSNVTAKYRTSIKALTDTGLMDGLNITLDGEAYSGMTSVGQWTTLEPTTTDVSTIHVVVELPEAAGNQYQDKSCSIEFGVTAVQGNAHTEDVDASVDYPVYTASDLMKVAKLSETTSFQGKTIALMEDVDLAGIEWKPIGNVAGYPSTTFWGTFDGNGHKISNMTVTDTTPNYAAAGLFGSVVGTVKNVTLVNPTVTSTHYAGAVVGYSSANASVIENCHVIGGTVTTTPELINGSYDNGDKAGGIIGYSVDGDKVLNCSVTGTTVTAYRDVGGLCGASGAEVTGNTVKDVTVIQNNLRAYKTSVDTYREVIGRELDGLTQSDNTYENVTVKSENAINSVADLAYFRDFVNASNASATTGKTYVLGADLDLTGVNWTPIGDVNSYPSKAFNGTFDGNGHTIANLTVVDTTTDNACAGLFGSLLGTVKNVTVKNATITSTHYAGGIVAYSSTSGCVVENCKVVDSTITSTPELLAGGYDNGDKVGGIIGYSVSGDKVTGCTVENTTVTAYRDLGGIVGCANGTVIVTNNVAKNVTVIQDNTNGYKSSVDTYHEIIGRDMGATASNNTATGCTVTSR